MARRDIANILDFEKQYPRTAVIALGENFRSTGHIVAAADAMIRSNRRRKHKDLFTGREQGEKVRVLLCRDEHHEARTVLEWLRRRPERAPGIGGDSTRGRRITWKDMAVFYRMNSLSRVMEDALRNAASLRHRPRDRVLRARGDQARPRVPARRREPGGRCVALPRHQRSPPRHR